jgi:hypothetical protein
MPIPFTPRTLQEAEAVFRGGWLRKELTALIQKWDAENAAKAMEEQRLQALKEAQLIKARQEHRATLKAAYVARSSPTTDAPHRAIAMDVNGSVSSVSMHVSYTTEKCTAGYVRYNPETGQGECIEWFRQGCSLPIPSEWNDHYTTGVLPFLPQCPVCKAQTIIRMETHGVVDRVECGGGWTGHYRWDPVKNQHYKLSTHGQVLWDPTDPDGKIAERKCLEAEIAEMHEKLAALQSKLATLTTA